MRTRGGGGWILALALFCSLSGCGSNEEDEHIPGNRPPIADAGADRSVVLGSLLTLDGSASRDPDGDPLSFHWLILSQPPGSTPMLSDATAIRPNFSTDTPGDYQIQLTVSDGLTESAPDTVRVTVEAAGANSAPLANAGTDQTVHVGSVVNLNGSGSSDPDEDPLFFAWVVVSQPPGSMIVLSAADTATPSFVPLVRRRLRDPPDSE